ncbi:MAG: methyltransferase domain-containing protein [Chloroflexi bacterium]|nr:methyltransferase domain-containing protein [Chloroflexota bacterium]MCI0646959.1 methyltransferase domain-containing protein [Chloroflexota bacterium]MCI0730007.1 methyltransferase domain-containing protein [Chloroflexota bacterium]
MTNPFNDPAMANYWVAMIRDGVNPFREFVSDPALLGRLAAWPAGGRVLDCGCGEGYLSRWLAGRGHTVIGLDLSLPLLQAARQAAGPGEQYLGGDAFRLPFAARCFDGLISSFLLIELADPAAAMAEMGRVLKPGGRLLFQLVHPFCFTANSGQTGGRAVTDYFTSQLFQEKFVVAGRESPLASIRYHHPLSTYTSALTRNGCHIVALEEPRPVAATPAGHPIHEILREPWFLLVEAEKGSGVDVTTSTPNRRNPLPVAVVLQPVDGGLLAVRRAIEPGRGKLALPGGYVELGESWQAAGAREVWEETGVAIDPAGLRPFDVHSAPDGTLLVFGLARPLAAADLPPFTPTPEADERVVITGPQELAFSLHTQVVQDYFVQKDRSP